MMILVHPVAEPVEPKKPFHKKATLLGLLFYLHKYFLKHEIILLKNQKGLKSHISYLL